MSVILMIRAKLELQRRLKNNINLMPNQHILMIKEALMGAS